MGLLQVRYEFHWGKNQMSAGLCSFLKTLREDLFLCFFRFLKATYIPWPTAPFLSSKPATLSLSDHLILPESHLPLATKGKVLHF